MTLATACFDTDSSVAEDSSNKFWCRKPQSDDSGKNDNQDSDNDSWPSSASTGSISINFGHEPSINDAAEESKASSRKSSNNFFFQPTNDYPGDGSASSSIPITLDIRRSSSSNSSNASRRRQTKLLLVALIESFCSIYGDHPENNRRIFFLICQTLNSMGFVDKEFVDEMASVRSSFQRAFQRLFWTALETIRSEDFQLAGRQRLITPSAWNENDDRSPSDAFGSIVEDTFSSVPSQFQQQQQLPTMGFDLSVDNSRYLSDFLELSLLGKGGFASAWRARNKLDDIEYAIKKVWLGNDISEDESNPYDKIFREIKSLARLEHKNVIRYYSSWLEWRQGRKNDDLDTDQHSDEEDDWTNHSDVSKKSTASIFEGKDPTFEDSGDFGYIPETSSTEISGGIDFVSDHSTSNPIDTNKESSNETEKAPPVISILKLGKSAECRRDNHCTFNVPEDCPLNNNQMSDGESGHITSPLSPPNSQPQVSSIPIVKRDRKHSHGRHGSFDYFSKPVRPHAPAGGWTLFIQMQLCPATLQDYIRHRNRFYTETGCCVGQEDCRKNIEIFSQILEGVSYIHEKGLIHRDLKPSNIFLGESSDRSRRRRSQSWSHRRSSKDDSSFSSSSDSTSSTDWFKRHLLEGDWVPKIGDFGLVASMSGTEGEAMVSASSPLDDSVSELGSSFGTAGQSLREIAHSIGSYKSASSSFKSDSYLSASRKPSRPKYHTSRTSPVGTITYASPEQLANPPLAYDQKVDIYSLGIIFFELYQPFATGMERAASLRDLKKGVLPDNFVKKFPKESALILWMMSEDPAQRPTAQQLIEFEMFAIPPDMYSSLHIQLQDKTKALDQKDSEVTRLRAAMAEKQRECDEMRLKIKRMEEALIKMELDHPSSDSATTTSRTFYPEDPDVEHVHRFTHWRNNTVAAAKDTTSQVFDQIKFIIE